MKSITLEFVPPFTVTSPVIQMICSIDAEGRLISFTIEETEGADPDRAAEVAWKIGSPHGVILNQNRKRGAR